MQLGGGKRPASNFELDLGHLALGAAPGWNETGGSQTMAGHERPGARPVRAVWR
ncbi:protein of unknown function [Candidatus Hydrogenisulfobacillus filiaventi]|uniref:Uncharacterized protein n=1 Tax=Candidatus Hydrogenisulfobacillus filiaventi TaxID=2707344 RepID=A0A6F8ZGJ6_9FIRM|nr:protein of unknown function [Candidatus Hydrogenisulfobacillus filiaventi]